MRIDWVVAVVVFLMFVGWAFAYHSLFSAGKIVSRTESASLAGEKIVDHIQVRLSSIPANRSSGADLDNVTLFAYMNWTGNEKNSTRVVPEQLSNASMPCSVSGDKVYWNASLKTGDNFFFIEYGETDSSLNCNQAVPLTEDNEAELWAAEHKDIFSTVKNAGVCGQMNNSYAATKSQIGVNFDFNVLLETGSGITTCGSLIPRGGREIFIYTAKSALFEGGEINISVSLW
jgi:hypothetical protein